VGEALVSSQLSDGQGIEIVGIFDIDSSKIGKRIGPLSVSSVRDLKQQVENHRARGGVIAVPAQEAQSVADELVDAGVRVLFNYSETLLDVPSDVVVRTSTRPPSFFRCSASARNLRLVPLQAIPSGFWPAITRRATVSSVAPVPSSTNASCVLASLGARDPESRKHHLKRH